MPNISLIADSGSTKTEWCLLINGKTKIFHTLGLSPYFLNKNQIAEVVRREVLPKMKDQIPEQIFFYGTGCKSPLNKKLIKTALISVFKSAKVNVFDDLTGVARSSCGRERGIACILGTGSNSCFYNGNKIIKNSPGLGFILGDEGSGAVLGKSLIQHYLYDIFENDLKEKFDKKFNVTPEEILDHVYRKPLPNRYLAAFAIFLAENRGNYMIENIIADGLNSFFYTHLLRYKDVQKYPIHFTGGIAWGFRDIILSLCHEYELKPGNIFKTPMKGLINYHKG